MPDHALMPRIMFVPDQSFKAAVGLAMHAAPGVDARCGQRVRRNNK
jgi:hypothetical protein